MFLWIWNRQDGPKKHAVCDRLADMQTAPPTPELKTDAISSSAVANQRRSGDEDTEDAQTLKLAQQLAKRSMSTRGNRSFFKWSFRSPQTKYVSDLSDLSGLSGLSGLSDTQKDVKYVNKSQDSAGASHSGSATQT